MGRRFGSTESKIIVPLFDARRYGPLQGGPSVEPCSRVAVFSRNGATKPLSHNAMRTIVRCALLAPALAFGVPAVRAEDSPDQKTAPASPPPNDSSPAPVAAPPAKPVPPFLAKAKPPPAAPAHPAGATGNSGDDSAKKPVTNPEFSTAIRRSFPFAPSAASAAETAQADEGLPVVDLKPFHVATSRIVERAAKGMEERREQEREKAFNAKDGGRFGKIGPAEIGLKFDPKHKGWDILSIPW